MKYHPIQFELQYTDIVIKTVILVKEQAYRSMQQNEEHRNSPMHIWPTEF